VDKKTTTKSKKLQIVLAKLVDDVRVIDPGARDLGIGPKFEAIKRPVALVWIRSGTGADLEKAQKFAPTEGYTVFVYAPTERNPLDRARADIAATA